MTPRDLQSDIALVKVLADRTCAELAGVLDPAPLANPPELVLKAILLCALHDVRSAERLCAALEDNLMFRWFLDADSRNPRLVPDLLERDCQKVLADGLGPRFFTRLARSARAAGLSAPKVPEQTSA